MRYPRRTVQNEDRCGTTEVPPPGAGRPPNLGCAGRKSWSETPGHRAGQQNV